MLSVPDLYDTSKLGLGGLFQVVGIALGRLARPPNLTTLDRQ